MFGKGGNAAERGAELRKQASLLDFVTEDIAKLKREVGPGDRQKIDQYLDSVREVERRIKKAEVDAADNDLPDLDVPTVSAIVSAPEEPSAPVLPATPAVSAPSGAVSNICSKVKVRFDSGEVLWLPVSKTEAFSELCSRASDRFSEIHGKRPVIALKSTDGASFHSSDLVSAMVSENQELVADVVKWDVRPIDQRYQDECSHRSARCFKNIEAALLESQLSNKFKLNCSLSSENSVPLLKALIFEDRLTELNLARNCLDKSCIEALCESLPSLKCLKTLNLSNTGLTCESLQPFETMFANGKGSCLERMISLNLNFNLFGDRGAKVLRAFLREAKDLEEVSLKSCGLSPLFFLQSPDTWRPVLLGLSKLKRLDLSFNPKLNANVHTFLETNIIDRCSLKFSHK